MTMPQASTTSGRCNTKTPWQVFLVGSEHLDTTLLHSMIASHPDAISFPEIQNFRSLIERQHPRMLILEQFHRTVVRQYTEKLRMKTRIGFLTKCMANKKVLKLPKEMNRMDLANLIPSKSHPSVRKYDKAFVHVLDRVCLKQGKRDWIEKSPNHIYNIVEIQHLVPEVCFIHIVRDEADVVTSLHDGAMRHSIGHDFTADIEQCIQRWMNVVQVAANMQHQPGHIIVFYNKLAIAPDITLRSVTDLLGLDFDTRMPEHPGSTAWRFTHGADPRETGVTSQINSIGRSKLHQFFSEVEQTMIGQEVGTIEDWLDCQDIQNDDPSDAGQPCH